MIPEDVVESVFNELKLNNQCLELKDLFDFYEKMFIIKLRPPMGIIITQRATGQIAHVKIIIKG